MKPRPTQLRKNHHLLDYIKSVVVCIDLGDQEHLAFKCNFVFVSFGFLQRSTKNCEYFEYPACREICFENQRHG